MEQSGHPGLSMLIPATNSSSTIAENPPWDASASLLKVAGKPACIPMGKNAGTGAKRVEVGTLGTKCPVATSEKLLVGCNWHAVRWISVRMLGGEWQQARCAVGENKISCKTGKKTNILPFWLSSPVKSANDVKRVREELKGKRGQ